MTATDIEALVEKAMSNGSTVTATDLLKLRLLPEEFWTARDTLGHIREAAWHRLVAPDAVFGAVLARLAALTPHTVELPPIVGSAVNLSAYSALVGPPESGKTAATSVAAELLPARDGILDRLPMGSGEGMVEILFEIVEEHDENGKPHKVKRQVRHAAIFHIDEGQALSDLGGRQGATLLPTLRTAWTGTTLGNANASAERRRILPAGSYVYGVTLGIQPELAAPLLSDVAAGTPQRFIWLYALDPNMPDDPPDWPGPLDWNPPSTGALALRRTTRGGWHRHPLGVPDAVANELRRHRQAVQRGEVTVDALDAHRHLCRFKIAGLLAILEQRLDVTDDDWALAGLVIDTSTKVRVAVEGAIEAVIAAKERAAKERRADTELHVDDKVTERALTSASRSAARVVHRHSEKGEHDGEGCTRRCLTQAMANKHRQAVGSDEPIEEAERNEWITPSKEGRWTPGKAVPR